MFRHEERSKKSARSSLSVKEAGGEAEGKRLMPLCDLAILREYACLGFDAS